MPDSHTYYRSSQVVISGPLENVIEARKKLIVSAVNVSLAENFCDF